MTAVQELAPQKLKELSEEDYMKLTITELNDILRELDLTVSGQKMS